MKCVDCSLQSDVGSDNVNMHCGLATICVFPFAEHACFISFPFTLCIDMVLIPWSQDHNLWSRSWSWPLTAPRQNLLVHHLFHPSQVRNGRVHPVLLMKLAICHISQTKTPAWTDVCCLPWSPATLMWWRMGDFRTGTQWTTNLHHHIHPLINILCVRHVDPSWEFLAGVGFLKTSLCEVGWQNSTQSQFLQYNKQLIQLSIELNSRTFDICYTMHHRHNQLFTIRDIRHVNTILLAFVRTPEEQTFIMLVPIVQYYSDI